MKKIICLTLLTFTTVFSFSQLVNQPVATPDSITWVDMMQDPNANFYDIQKAFYKHWSTRKMEKGKGYKVFKRWENYMEPRVYPTGDVKQASQTYENYKLWQKTANFNNKSFSGNWNFLGPIGKSTGGGAGRLNFVRFDPTNSNKIFVGAPDGGLWISTNGGTSFTTNTDQLTVIGCSDIAIDPTNTQVMYLATGDGEGSDTYSIGVLKSTDGGTTWNTTGLSWTVSQARNISKILINPNNTNIIMAAASNGVWRSTDAGATWTSATSGYFYDLEFKPGDPNVVYAAGLTMKRSTNGGSSFSAVTLPTSGGIRRISMAVTAANSNYVYLLIGSSSTNGLMGIYRSTDSGVNFTERADDSPNYLGWEYDGSDFGGQAFYDLTIAASPTNSEEVIIGGINSWRSTNGGTSFNLLTHWYGGGGAPEVHADHHDIQYLNGTTIFDANDGGIYKSTNSGTSWTDLSSNLVIAQQYRIGTSASAVTPIISGHQDNGTNRLSGSAWKEVYGGDGMDCFIDRTNNNIMVGSYVYGDYYKSTDGGNSFSSIASGLPSGDWLSVIHQDPVNANTYYAGGRTDIYKTTNGGSSWTALGNPSSFNSIIEFAIAPSNNQIIYAVTTNSVNKSTDGGNTWSSVTSGLPTSSASPTNVTVSNTNANVVFVTFSGYSAANKVFKSTNGGTNWTNITTGLPNVPCNTIVYHNSSTDEAVYVGTDVGVFYKDNSMSSWTAFSFGLPVVSVRDLEIYYPTGRLRAATFGRGTWDSDLFSNAIPPTANYAPSSTSICSGSTVTFTNSSTGIPTSYVWSFQGGNPATSNAINPTVTYASPGAYDVQLIAINASGSDTLTQIALINVLSGQALPFNEDFSNSSFPYPNWTLTDVISNGTWQQTTAAGNSPSAGNSVMFNNASIDDRGNEDEFGLPSLNLSTTTSSTLTFDVAYAPYDAVYFDSLEVLISTDCGTTFSSLYLNGNTGLATAPSTTSPFVPASSEWRTESVDLTPYVSFANVVIKFRNKPGYGNNIYIDNINIIGVPGIPPTASFSQNQNTLCPGDSVTFTNTSSDNPTSYSWSFPGGSPATSSIQNPVIHYNTSGVYDVQLIVANNFGKDTLLLTNQINVNAAPAKPTISAGGPLTFCAGGSVTLTSSSATGNTWSNGDLTSSVTISSSDTLTVSLTNGTCTSISLPTIVTVNPIPPTPTITANGPITFCQGSSVNISSSAASNNKWSTGQTTQSISVSASATITNTVIIAGCTSPVSNSIIVKVNPLPIVNLPNFAKICDTANALVLTGGTPAGGTYSGTGVSSGNFNPAISGVGTFTITYTFKDVNNCTAVDQGTIIVTTCTSAELDESKENGFVIYPNPTQNYLTLKGDKLANYKKIELIDTEGKLLKTWKIESLDMKLDLSSFAAGNYTVRVSNDEIGVLHKIQIIK